MSTTKKIGFALVVAALLWHYKGKAKTPAASTPVPQPGNGNPIPDPVTNPDNMPVILPLPDIRQYKDGDWIAYRDLTGKNKKGVITGYENGVYFVRPYQATEVDRVPKDNVIAAVLIH